MAQNLAPVYLDDTRVQLQGDPCPRVSKIMSAGGKAATGDVQVVRLASLEDQDGRPLALDDVIDRAVATGPVYLRSLRKGAADPGSSWGANATGMGGSVTAMEYGGAGQEPRDDPQSSIGNRRSATQRMAFGAARPGMAGTGAESSEGDVPLDKQAKSDYSGPGQAQSEAATAARAQRNGGPDQSYGVGDLAPGGRTGLTDAVEHAADGSQRHGNPDSTQDFQSGGRSGEGLAASMARGRPGDRGAPPLVTADEGVGSTQRRQAAPKPGAGTKDPAQGAQGGDPVEPTGDLRDSSTDNQGRQQAQGHDA